MKSNFSTKYQDGKIYVVAGSRYELHRLYFQTGIRPRDIQVLKSPEEIRYIPGETVMVTRLAQDLPEIEDFMGLAFAYDCHLVRL